MKLKTSRATTQRYHFKARNRDDDRHATGAPIKGKSKGKGKENAKKKKKTTRRGETASVGPQKATVHLEKHAHSSVNQTRKAKGRGDLVHLLRLVHRTETQKVTEKVAMTEVWKTHLQLTGKSPSGKANRLPCTSFKKGSCHREIHVIVGMFPMCTKFKAPDGCRFGDKCAYKHTTTPADERKISAAVAIYIPARGERQMQKRKIQSDDKTQYRVRLHHLANKYVPKRENWDLPLESSRPDLEINRIRSLQHSRKDLSNGLRTWKKKQGQQLVFFTRTCQVHILRIKRSSSSPFPRALWEITYIGIMLLRERYSMFRRYI